MTDPAQRETQLICDGNAVNEHVELIWNSMFECGIVKECQDFRSNCKFDSCEALFKLFGIL